MMREECQTDRNLPPAHQDNDGSITAIDNDIRTITMKNEQSRREMT
jgi:hypothetical protein